MAHSALAVLEAVLVRVEVLSSSMALFSNGSLFDRITFGSAELNEKTISKLLTVNGALGRDRHDPCNAAWRGVVPRGVASIPGPPNQRYIHPHHTYLDLLAAGTLRSFSYQNSQS